MIVYTVGHTIELPRVSHSINLPTLLSKISVVLSDVCMIKRRFLEQEQNLCSKLHIQK